MVTIWLAIFPSAIVWTLRSIRCRTNRAARLTAHWSLWHVLSLKKNHLFLLYNLFFNCDIFCSIRLAYNFSTININYKFLYVLLEMSSSRIRAFQIAAHRNCICARHFSEKFFFLFLLKMLYLKLFRLIFPAACITRQNTHVNYVSCMMGSHAMLCQKSSARWDISRWFEEHMDDSIAV